MNVKTLVALFLLAVSSAAQADTSIELAAGRSYGPPRANGTWYQKGFPYQIHTQALAYSLGVRTDATAHLALHADYVSIGNTRTDAWAVTSDALYTPDTPTHCPGVCPRLADYKTSGTVRGLQLLAELHTGGAWDLGVMAGPFYYRENWTLDVPDWFPTEPAPGGFTAGPVHPIYVHTARWAEGAAAGLRLTHRSQFLSLMWYDDAAKLRKEQAWPTNWQYHVVLTYGLTF